MDESNKYLIQMIEGCKRGQLNSQRCLYEHFYGYGLSIALRYAQHREEAVEILNDTFLKIFSKLNQYKPAQPFKPWFRQILIHTAIDYHRVHHKFPTPIDIDSVTKLLIDNDTPLPIVFPNEDVMPFVQSLPPQYRLVFNLFVMEEYDHKEIAVQLGITESTSRSNLARAKEKLKEMILNQVPKNGQLAYKKYSKTDFDNG